MCFFQSLSWVVFNIFFKRIYSLSWI
jgi:hypothetical protein